MQPHLPPCPALHMSISGLPLRRFLSVRCGVLVCVLMHTACWGLRTGLLWSDGQRVAFLAGPFCGFNLYTQALVLASTPVQGMQTLPVNPHDPGCIYG